jgi:hypothetical protein
MTTLAATYVRSADVYWAQQRLLRFGIAPDSIRVAAPGSLPIAGIERSLIRAGVSAWLAAHLSRRVARGETLLAATVAPPDLRDHAAMVMAEQAQCPDLVGEIVESGTTQTKLAELRARLTSRAAASRAPSRRSQFDEG